MSFKTTPDQIYLQECFTYNPFTGFLTWKERPQNHFNSRKGHGMWNARYPGRVAGSVSHKGYLRVVVDASDYPAHRIIWKLMHNEDPEQVDHIYGDRWDNRISMLRKATYNENAQNRKTSVLSTTQLKGVSPRPNGTFRARIGTNPRVSLGSFSTAEAAHQAYCSAAESLYGSFARAA